MPLVVVVPDEVAPSVIVVPSTTILSFAPSCNPLTVNVRPVIVCPASTVPTDAPLNTATGEACVPKPAASVNVGFTAVAVSVGASFTEVTLTVDVTGLELDEPSLTVKFTVRIAVDGFSELFEYCTARNAACHCASVAVLPRKINSSRQSTHYSCR